MDYPMLGVSDQFNIPQAQPQSGGMFGGGDPSWRNALMAALAGFMARRSPGVAGNIINGLQEARTLKERAAQAQAQHQQEMQDQIALHQANRDYDIAHAPPPDIQDRIDVLNKIDPTLGMTYAKNYAANGGGVGPAITNPVTGQMMMPAAKAPTQAPPAEAIARLKANPGEASQFDEVFGPGASARVLGGPTPSASGGFPY
jgi:hypothetical protein